MSRTIGSRSCDTQNRGKILNFFAVSRTGHKLVTKPDEVVTLKDRLSQVDGILVIHLNIEIWDILKEILSAGQPTMIFAIPYSGHEWVHFGELRKQPLGTKMDCILSSNTDHLAMAVRPFRAIHHLREAKIMNLTTADFSEYADKIKNRFGTEIKQVSLSRMAALYNSISDREAKEETERWIYGASQVIEPSEENATVMTLDC